MVAENSSSAGPGSVIQLDTPSLSALKAQIFYESAHRSGPIQGVPNHTCKDRGRFSRRAHPGHMRFKAYLESIFLKPQSTFCYFYGPLVLSFN